MGSRTGGSLRRWVLSERKVGVWRNRFAEHRLDEIPAGNEVHAILDNLQVHKTPEVNAWLDAPPLDVPLHPDTRLLAEPNNQTSRSRC